MSRRRLYVGHRVRVAKAEDFACPHEFIGLEGRVVGFNTDGQTGNDEANPLIEVQFNRRVYYADVNSKWKSISPKDHWATKYAFWRGELRFVR